MRKIQPNLTDVLVTHTYTHTCTLRILLFKSAGSWGMCMWMCVCLDKCLFPDMSSSPHCEPWYAVFNNSQANSTLTRAWKLNDYLPFCSVCVCVCVCASVPMGLQVCVRAYLYFFFNACIRVLVCHRVCPVCATQCFCMCLWVSLNLFLIGLWTFFH